MSIEGWLMVLVALELLGLNYYAYTAVQELRKPHAVHTV